MKIEIEFTGSTDATVTIDGRELKYAVREGAWSYQEGIEAEELETTIGGLVAMKLTDVLIDILQGYYPENEEYRDDGEMWETWDVLSEEAAEDVRHQIY